MDDDWVVGESVEMWYGLHKDGRCGGDGSEFSGANWCESREQRVGVMSDCLDLWILINSLFFKMVLLEFLPLALRLQTLRRCLTAYLLHSDLNV